MKKYYVTLQDGLIRETPASYTNFYEFEVKLTDEQKQEFEEILNTNDVKLQYQFMLDKLIQKKDISEVKRILKN